MNTPETRDPRPAVPAPAPRASIVILNFNYGRFLPQAIDSALSQTCAGVEVVVVDDGSTDDSREIIRGYGNRIVPVIKPNGGMHTALNAGFAASRGEILIFLDADDLLMSTAVERVLQVHQDLAVVKSHWPLRLTDAQGKPMSNLVPRYPLANGDLLDAVAHGGPDACHGSPTSGNSWSRRFLDEVLPIRDDRFRRHAEVYLGTLAPVHGKIVLIREPLGMYRIHGRNDFACAPALERNRRNLALYDARCDVLAPALDARGHHYDRAAWSKGRNSYLWMHELETAIDGVIPERASFILVDEGQWPGLVSGRHATPLVEIGGVYWGLPQDSQDAMRHFQRCVVSGATFLVFAWPSFWWQDSYPEFWRHLEHSFERPYCSERVMVFDLTKPIQA